MAKFKGVTEEALAARPAGQQELNYKTLLCRYKVSIEAIVFALIMDANDISNLISQYGESLKRVLPRLVGVLGEGIVLAELTKLGIPATLCDGQKRAVDLRTKGGLSIQVKTAQEPKFVTKIGQKRFDARHLPDVWVLVLLADINKPRFFVLTHQEICTLQKARNQQWNDEYFKRHGNGSMPPETQIKWRLVGDSE